MTFLTSRMGRLIGLARPSRSKSAQTIGDYHRTRLSCESLETRMLLSANGPSTALQNPDLEFISTGSGGLDFASAIAFQNDHVYVASHLTAEILRFDADTGEFVDTFVAGGSGGLVRPAVVEFGPDGNLYVASNGDLGGAAGTDAILRYDGNTGAFIDEFVPTQTAGLEDPRGMTFGPDGFLYVASRITDEVLRFDGTTGAFTDVFVSANSGGLDKPFNMQFGSDGNLYVASRATDSVKRFDGTTGAYVDDFVTTGSGGLTGPRDLVFGSDGLLYVGSKESHEVLRFDASSGAYIDTFVASNSELMDGLYTIEFGPDGNLYAGGHESDNVVLYDATSGNPLPPDPPPASDVVLLSLRNNQTVDGVSFANEDILAFDGTGFQKQFDGSDVGLGSLRIDAFSFLTDTEILISFDQPGSIAGVGTVDDSDLVLFSATQLGDDTDGSFSLYFDGSDVGLTLNGEDIDGLDTLPDGTLLISTNGSPRVPGVSGRDEDILAFSPTSLGTNTSGTWSMYFDGSDVGLANSSGEDVNAFAVAASGAIQLSTVGDFGVNGQSGADEDIFTFNPASTGSNTSGSFDLALLFDGSEWGLTSNDIYGLDIRASVANAAQADDAESAIDLAFGMQEAEGASL